MSLVSKLDACIWQITVNFTYNKLWVHKKCSGLTGRLVADPEFVCQGCRGVACPVDGRPVARVDVDGTRLDVGATF